LRIAFRIIGAVIGAAFGLLVCVVLIALLGDGNTVAEGFLFLPGAPIGLLTGAIAGAIFASHAAKLLGDQSTSDTVRGRKRRLTLALVLGIPAAFIAVGWIAKEAHEPPSDAAMLRDFTPHEATFNTLVEMIAADKALDRVDENWTMPADTKSVGVSPERLADYRRLLRDAGTPRGFQVSPAHDEFKFFYWLRGSAISDDMDKGFAYRTTPPASTVQTLDGIRSESRDAFVAYRHVRGNWYLFYEFTPD
jgi:hypothetical protein